MKNQLKHPLADRAEELAKVAEQMQCNSETTGGLIILGLLLNEGLRVVASAIEKVAEAMMKPYQH